MATVVLPGASWAEKGGSVTSVDHRIRSLSRAIASPGAALEDWEILATLYGRLQKQAVSISRAGILTEVSSLSRLYDNINFAGDERHRPCLKAPYRPVAKGFHYQTPHIDEVQPGLQLVCGKSIYHFGTTTTWAAGPLEVESQGHIRMHPQEAARVGAGAGDCVKLTSSKGSVTAALELDESLPEGLIFAPYHFADLEVQTLLEDGSNRVGVKLAKA
jgi:formate dehydrogenase alpha subunit